jgi:uncharacterized membrane protein YfhO
MAEALVREPVPVSGASPTSSARIVDYQPEHIAIDVDASSNGLLVLSEVVYPGWRATVDGVETPILQADVALRAVSVPAGRHRVEMVFQPASVTIGQIASGVVWVVAGVALVWMKRAG